MTTHVHVYCNRCGLEVRDDDQGVRLIVAAARRDVAVKTVDLCGGCAALFKAWMGDREVL
jgi:hypothetical protein